MDLLFFIDIFLSFLTPYERPDGTYEYNFKKISRHYSLSQLPIDVFAAFPTHFLEEGAEEFITSESIQKKLERQFTVLRFLRIVKVFKIKKYAPLVNRLISFLNLNPTKSRILLIVVGAMFLVHIFACLFYLEAKLNSFAANTWVF